MHKKLETHGNDQVADNNAVSTSLDVLREFWPRYIEIGFSSLLIGGLGLLLPLFSMLVYDKVVGNGNIETLWALSIGMLLFVLIEFVLRIVRQQTLDYLAARSDVRMERSLLGRLLDPQVTLRASVGEMLSRFKDYTLARDMLYAQYMVAMADAPFVLLFLLALLLIGGPVVLGVLSIGTLMFIGQKLLHAPQSSFGLHASKMGSQRLDLLAEIVNGADVLKTSSLATRIERQWNKLLLDGALNRAKGRFWHGLGQAWGALNITLASMLTLIIGVYRVEQGAMTIGALIACGLITLRTMAAWSSVTGLILHLKHLRNSYTELQVAVGSPPSERKAQMPVVPVRGELLVRNLRIRFDQRGPVLDELNIHIQPGEKIALVGTSGSGKSTLLRCLAGVLRPESGDLLLDNMALHAHSLQNPVDWLAYKPQFPVLFAGTVYDNLFANPEQADTPRARAVLAAVLGTANDTRGLSLDLTLEAGGANLSGGQRQLLALARALLPPAQVFIFDEPTAGLDAATEKRLVKALLELTQGATWLVATHSTHVLGIVDRIIVLNNGKILADGPRDQILLPSKEPRVSS